MIRFPAVIAAVIAALPLPAVGAAQSVRGTVVDRADQPMTGVIVVLLDSAQGVAARSLTNDRGEYRVLAPRTGTYHLRTLRIGFQPTVSASFEMATSATRIQRIVLDGISVSLAAMRVVDRTSCTRDASRENLATLAAWDQAMTTMAAAAVTSSSRGLVATMARYERTLDASGRQVKDEKLQVGTSIASQPWHSLPADTLRHRGYWWVDATDSTTFYAPSLEVLLSAPFIEDHCLRLVASRDTGLLGVAFEPVPERRQRAEVRGTLWLARASAELRRMEFTFTNTPGATNTRTSAGGSMAFAHLPDGAVVITDWEIRMPLLVKLAPRATSVRVAAIATTGGNLLMVRRGVDTLFRTGTAGSTRAP